MNGCCMADVTACDAIVNLSNNVLKIDVIVPVLKHENCQQVGQTVTFVVLREKVLPAEML
jgi:hypothetical protein